MNKIRVTQFQRNNAHAAYEWWKTAVPPERVTLETWCTSPADGVKHCGTLACFGGWLPACEHFAALGLTAAARTGEPRLRPNDSSEFPRDVSEFLFGYDRMFMKFAIEPWPERTKEEVFEDGSKSKTHHQAVLDRLEWLILNSEVVG